MSDSAERLSAMMCTARPAARASNAVRGPMQAMIVSGGSGASCWAICRAMLPEVTRMARMRPEATSAAVGSVTGTPTVR